MGRLEKVLRFILILNGLSCFALSLAYMIILDDPSRWFGCFLLLITGILCIKTSRSVKYEHNS
ncbi:MAG TPA: hypothetical protein GX708_15460 [Gallicola sp.]|nr:hypothetical protein [Gallicola sp.]